LVLGSSWRLIFFFAPIIGHAMRLIVLFVLEQSEQQPDG
jgi:hypothetical protein